MIFYRNWYKLLLIRMNNSKESKYTFLFDEIYYWIIYFLFPVYFQIQPHFIVPRNLNILFNSLSKHNLLKKKHNVKMC